MAYVDLESDNSRFRVILSNHSSETPVEQLSDQCTGIFSGA